MRNRVLLSLVLLPMFAGDGAATEVTLPGTESRLVTARSLQSGFEMPPVLIVGVAYPGGMLAGGGRQERVSTS